jgi:hypothetical protein
MLFGSIFCIHCLNEPFWEQGPDGNTVDFFAAIRDADMAADLTVQPVMRFGVDAAIVYSDILIIPQAMNCTVEMVPVRDAPRAAAPRCRLLARWSPASCRLTRALCRRAGHGWQEEGDPAGRGGARPARAGRQGGAAEPGPDAPQLPQAARLPGRPRRARLQPGPFVPRPQYTL